MSGDESALAALDLPTDPDAALEQVVADDAAAASTDQVVKLVVYCDACGEATNRFDPDAQGRAAEAARVHIGVAERYGEPCSNDDTRIVRVFGDGRREEVTR